VYSTTHYEAIHIGTPTLILALRGHKYVSNLIQKKYARLCREPQELVSLITSSVEKDQNWKRWIHDTLQAQKGLFAEDPAGSSVSHLNKIIKEKYNRIL
jgi:hypothetical protein